LRHGKPGDALATAARGGLTGHRLEWRRPPARGGSVEARQRPRGPVHGRRTAGHPQPDQQAHADDPGRRGDAGTQDHARAAVRRRRQIQGPPGQHRRGADRATARRVGTRGDRQGSSASREAVSNGCWGQRSSIDNQSGKALASSSSTVCSGADTLPMPRNPPAASATPRARSSTRPLKKRLSSALIVSTRART